MAGGSYIDLLHWLMARSKRDKARELPRTTLVANPMNDNVTVYPNPLNDEAEEEADDVADNVAGGERLDQMLKDSAEKSVERAGKTGDASIEVDHTKAAGTVAALKAGGGIGAAAAQFMIVCSWMMTFNLVIAVDLAWPEWWHGLWGWCSFFAFPFKFFVPVDLIFPSVAVSNAAEYFATLTVQPLLALYVWYRASFFHEKSVTSSGDSLRCYNWLFTDAKKDWIRWDTGRRWLGTVVLWLSFWLVPPAVGLALAIKNDTLEPVEQGNETVSSRDTQEYHMPWYSAAWLCFGSFVPLLLGLSGIQGDHAWRIQDCTESKRPGRGILRPVGPQRVHTACIHHVDHALVSRRRIYGPLETTNRRCERQRDTADDLGRFCARDARDFGSAGLGARPPL